MRETSSPRQAVGRNTRFLKCDPATIFGSLPARFNLSRPSGNLGFSDVMSIPPSVARRAYQSAIDGAGPGIAHSGGLAGFALPVLRYFVGASESQAVTPLALISPSEGATINSAQSPIFTWVENQSCAFV